MPCQLLLRIAVDQRQASDTLHEVKLADAWVLINLQSSMRHRYNALPGELSTYGECLGMYSKDVRFQFFIILDTRSASHERLLFLVWCIQRSIKGVIPTGAVRDRHV